MASSLELNKTLAAILTAGIIASGAGVISRIIYSPHLPEENAYPIEVSSTAGEGAGAGEGAPAVSLAALLAGGDAAHGQNVAKACAACHNFGEGEPNKIGPHLWGIVGRDIAAVSDFAYSDALAQKEGAWDYEQLGHFLANPKGFAPGTKMAYAGIRKEQDLADVILYLRSISPDAPPLPEPEAAVETAAAEAGAGGEPTAATEPPAAAAGQDAGQAAGGVAALLAAADPAAGEKAAKKCSVCHAFEQGGAAKLGPPLWGVLGREIASVDGFGYSEALAGKEGAWDYANLDAYLASPRDWAPGTKMAFAGVKKPAERADIIVYLRSLADNPEPLPAGG